MQKNLGQRVLERAVEKFGEAGAASRENELRRQLSGQAHVPEALLLRAVDLVLDGEAGSSNL